MSETKWERRDRKLTKRANSAMKVDNRSLKSVILPIIAKKAKETRRVRAK